MPLDGEKWDALKLPCPFGRGGALGPGKYKNPDDPGGGDGCARVLISKRELAGDKELFAEASALLAAFEPLLKGEGQASLNPGGLGRNDIEVLPTLRNMTCVGGLDWPPAVKAYVEAACAKAGVSTYFDEAIAPGVFEGLAACAKAGAAAAGGSWGFLGC